ncbi:DNA transformation protein and related proteins [Gammaproteobacteria bacterium]
MSEQKSISDLKSLGPKSQEMLARAGITSVDQLREMGSVAAYVKAKQANGNVSLNLLWGLESALTGEPWQDVARLHRTSLLMALVARENNPQFQQEN